MTLRLLFSYLGRQARRWRRMAGALSTWRARAGASGEARRTLRAWRGAARTQAKPVALLCGTP